VPPTALPAFAFDALELQPTSASPLSLYSSLNLFALSEHARTRSESRVLLPSSAAR
jgi:hypothetical protein